MPQDHQDAVQAKWRAGTRVDRGARLLVCPICFIAKQLDSTAVVSNAEIGGSVQLWEWTGDDGATTLATERHRAGEASRPIAGPRE
jgi:hypothetical protein